jgi:hypothetical protein
MELVSKLPVCGVRSGAVTSHVLRPFHCWQCHDFEYALFRPDVRGPVPRGPSEGAGGTGRSSGPGETHVPQ